MACYCWCDCANKHAHSICQECNAGKHAGARHSGKVRLAVAIKTAPRQAKR